MMKPTRQCKNAQIQSLLLRGKKPRAVVLHRDRSADAAREKERELIVEHKKFPWSCNTADGGEGITPGALHQIYGLYEPWEGGRCFYIGIAIDVESRLKTHIQEAKENAITLTKRPDLGKILAEQLDKHPGNLLHVLGQYRSESAWLRRCFFPTPEAYERTWLKHGCYGTDAIPLKCGWFMHRFYATQQWFALIAHLHKYSGKLFAKPAKAAIESHFAPETRP
ncbi:MAG: hypothetical protein WBE86_03400 [Candidatus Acidiferrales bacterium]